MQLIVLISAVLYYVDASRILAVFPYQGKSHQFIIQPVLKGLLDRGHEVTCITGLPLNTNSSNYREIYLKPPSLGWTDSFTFDIAVNSWTLNHWNLLHDFSPVILTPFLESEEVHNLFKSNEKYDVVLVEASFIQEPSVFFGYKFNAPVISVSSCDLVPIYKYYLGSEVNPSYMSQQELYFSDEMTLVQRMENTFHWIFELVASHWYYIPQREKFAREKLGSLVKDYPPLSQGLSDISLYLINTDPLSHYPSPSNPNVIPIPGLHIDPSPPQLPKDLLKIVEASQGVLLFSLGSMVPVSKMPQDQIQAFFDAFSKFPLTILWKSDTQLKNVPSNVVLRDWLPQKSILHHPKCKALMSHGGLLSKQEALYYGVPIITIPLFGDQPMNSALSQVKGYGVTLSFSNVSSQSVTWALDTVLKPEFKERAKKNSQIFQEHSKDSLARATFWVEYVIKFQGAQHLKSPATSLYWFQRYLIDIVIIEILVLGVFVTMVIRCCCTRATKRSKSKIE